MHTLLKIAFFCMVSPVYSFQPVTHFSHIFPYLVNKQISSQEKETVRALLEEVNKAFDNNPELIKQPLPSLFLQELSLLEKERTHTALQEIHLKIDTFINSTKEESHLFDCIDQLNVRLGTMFGSYSPPLSHLIKKKLYYRPLKWARRNKKYSVPLAIAAATTSAAVLILWAVAHSERIKIRDQECHDGEQSEGAPKIVTLKGNDLVESPYNNALHNQADDQAHIVFAHGFGAGHWGKSCKDYYTHGIFPPQKTVVTTFDFQDVVIKNQDLRSISWHKASIAQKGDIERLRKALIQTKGDVLGFGVSRGAATWLTTLGLYLE